MTMPLKMFNNHNLKSEKNSQNLQAMQEQAWELNLDSSEGLRPEKKRKVEKPFKVQVNTKNPDKMRHVK